VPLVSEDMLLQGGLLLGDEWIFASSAGDMEHVNPATGKVQASFPIAGPPEVDRAVDLAREALAEWRKMPPAERQAVLLRIASLLRENADLFSLVTTLENGTPISTTGIQATLAATWFEYYAGWVDKVSGDVVPMAGSFNYTLLEPSGVVAIILTWNGPTGSIGMKVAAALAAGCTVVLKPPELAPFSTSLFGRLALEAGLPPGVLNVVPGGPVAGDRLVRHPGIDKISFTGSPLTAARIQAACAESLTPLVLELGGKSANIVLEDADLSAASMSAAMGVAAMSGQICVAPTRLIVQSHVHDELVERIAEVFRGIKVGNPLDPSSFMGPLINATAKDRVMRIIDQARSDGRACLVTGGDALGGDLADGYFVSPTLFTNVDNSSSLAQEEAFGPVLSVLKADTADQAVALANDTRYGLAAYLHTRDLNQALRLAAKLDAGNVAINGGSPVAGPYAPFGGFKDSGYGKEGGLEGLMEYMRVKNVNIALPVE
jgi:aldehyde dehydrogenase (NAD+)